MAVQPLAGLDLNAVADSAIGETNTRIAGGQSALDGMLASMLNEQRGLLGSQAEMQGRDQSFQRAQAILTEAMARREQALREAEAAARLRFEENQGALDRASMSRRGAIERAATGGEPDWFTQQRFQTDENIRQAKALAAMEAGERRRAERAEQPRLSDFGKSTINPFRGQAIQSVMKQKPKGGAAWRKPLTSDEIKRTQEAVMQHGNMGLSALTPSLREIFGSGSGSSGRASLALWQLGYLGPDGAAG